MSATPLSTLPAKRGGRPTKLTPETRARIIQLVARGVPHIHACRAVRISFPSFCNYRKQHPDFDDEIQQAISAAIEKRLAVIEKAADAGDVNAAKWYLERCHPEFFSRNRLEVTGADGAPLAIGIGIYLPQKDGTPSIEVKTVATEEIENG